MMDDIAQQFFAAFPDRVDWRTVGREAEHPVVTPDGEAADIAVLWPLLAGDDLQPWFEGTLQVGLKGPDYTYSAEVGKGTIEIITEPREDLFQLRSVYERARDRLLEAAEIAGVYVLGYGIQPRTEASTDLMAPKQRYGVMHEILGDLWLWFTLTASDQVHATLPRHEALLATNAGNLMAPVIIALCANSPIYAGRPSGFISAREGEMGRIGAEGHRHGMPAGPVSSETDLVEQLCRLRYLMRRRDGRWAAQQGRFVDHAHDPASVYADFLDHEHYVWHTARPRSAHGTLEIRAACQQPGESHDAASALGVAIVAAAPVLMTRLQAELGDEVWPAMRRWHHATIREGLSAAPPTSGLLEDLLQDCTDALAARGRGEEALLGPMWDRISAGRNPGQRVAEAFDEGGLSCLLSHCRIA